MWVVVCVCVFLFLCFFFFFQAEDGIRDWSVTGVQTCALPICFSDHIALAKHHCPEKPVAFANEGDGAVIPTPDGPALGVVQGENVYVRTPERLGLVDRKSVV